MNGADLRVHSLGAGVQSTTLALLMAEGLLPKPDVAIFADTGWEPAAVYEHLDRLAPVLNDAGIEVERVAAGNIRADSVKPGRFVPVPFFTRGDDGSSGMARRQCTNEYKLVPILAAIRRRLGAEVDPDTGKVGRVRGGRWAEVSIGISADEGGRAKASRVRYVRNVHPLLEAFDLPWSRTACETWLADNWPHPVPRSACIGCPYRSDAEWAALTPDEFAEAVQWERDLNAAESSFTGDIFLHRDRIPLDRVELRPRDESAQATFFDSPSCSPWGCERSIAAGIRGTLREEDQ